MYHVSEVLADAKTHYTQPQKLLYALLITSRKLRHYFQAHKIIVLSSFTLGEIIRNRDANGHIVKWSVELGEFDIEFCPRQAIKSQILADFVSEWTKIQMPPPKERPEHWIMYFDGTLNLEGAGAGILLISPQGGQLKYVLQIHYKASSNGAEYEALIQTPYSSVPWHQAITGFWRFQGRHRISQQGVELRQRHDGCLLC
jgi:hypothetical protein